MSDNSNPLLLFKGEAHQLTLEPPEKMETSFFLDVYAKAMSCLYDIDVDNQKYQNAEKEDGSRHLTEFNNIIAFCGERGSGKSSAMMSFRKLLRNWRKNCCGKTGGEIGNLFLPLIGTTKREVSEKSKFLCIDSVDPSRFEPSDRLIGTVVAELYRRYIEIANKKTDKGDFDKQKKLEDAFEKALKGVQMLGLKGGNPFGTPGEAENVFEILKRVSEGASMRELFHELVVAFLNYQFGTSGDSLGGHYLVIPIDDLDMSIEHAYQLAEDIRKYLMVPNVVILVAMKFDQLRLAVEQENVGRFKQYRDATNPKRPTMNEIEAMSNLYLEKLVPIPRIVMMPMLGTVSMAKHRGLFYGKKNEGGGGYESQGSIEKVVLRKIKETTALCFLPKEGAIHLIIPKTLRELHNFLEYLDDLGPIGEGPARIKNISKFQNYFLEQWVPANLERGDEAVIKSIHNSQLSHKKRIAIVSLRKRIKASSESFLQVKMKSEFSPLYEGLNSIPPIVSDLHMEDNPLNITLGSLLWHIRELEKNDIEYEYRYLIFAIRTFFSFELLCGINDPIEFPNLTNTIGGAVFELNFAKLFTAGPYLGKSNLISGNGGRFRVGSAIGSDGQETSLFVYVFEKIKKELELSFPNKVDNFRNDQFTKVLLAVCSFFYFGKNAVESKRNTTELWFAGAGNIDGGGSLKHLLFDFWAILFWNAVPRTNFDRFFQDAQNTKEVIDAKSANASILDRQKFSELFTTLLQIEVLERISNETSSYIKRMWKNASKLQQDRELWTDINDLSHTVYKALYDINRMTHQKRENNQAGINESAFREDFWGLGDKEWEIFELTIRGLQDVFFIQEMDVESGDTNLANKAIGEKTIPKVRTLTPNRSQLDYYKDKFIYYRNNPKKNDRVRVKSKDFIERFEPFLLPKEMSDIRHAEHSAWGNPSDMGLRKQLASLAIKAIDGIFERSIRKP